MILVKKRGNIILNEIILPFGIASSHQMNNFLIGCVAIDTIVLNLHNIYIVVFHTIHVNKMKSNEK